MVAIAMKKLYVVIHPGAPNFFCKARSEGEALQKFFVGIKLQVISEYKDAIAQLCTFEMFMKLTPDEFLVNANTSF